jgi:hypothetical protein
MAHCRAEEETSNRRRIKRLPIVESFGIPMMQNGPVTVAQPIFTDNDRPLPVVCSGQWGGQAPETWQRTGKTLDLMYLCGGGVVAHRAGPASGVLAVQQAWQAAVAGVSLEDYAKGHRSWRNPWSNSAVRPRKVIQVCKTLGHEAQAERTGAKRRIRMDHVSLAAIGLQGSQARSRLQELCF